jgi:hypothetical protein
MTRHTLALAAAIGLATALPADDEKESEKPTVNLSGSLDDRDLKIKAQPDGVIVSPKKWDELAKAWGIKDPPKVDFDKEFLVVAMTDGSRLNLSTKREDGGNLRTVAIATRDLRPGFRYAIQSVKREGVKTVNGKELPKE